jgi:peptidoglycan/xylan/chitin deacetylase (PgdA/CDA1 family)
VTPSALIVAYHAVESGPAPLCIDPGLFREHLDALADAGAVTLAVSELAAALRRGRVPDRAVALTFDDAFASVAAHAAPLLAERGLGATVYAVAGRLGGLNDWPSQHPHAPRRRLLGGTELRALAGAGIEIGAHGMHHAPLDRADARLAEREVVRSKQRLEADLQLEIRSFAYPYGASPSPAARRLVEATYEAACTTRPGRATAGADPFSLARVDAHYLRSPELMAHAARGGLGPYLGLRRTAARARRVFVKDYRRAPAA